MHIYFISQYCVTNIDISNPWHKFIFDYYLPDNQIIIEYDGIQHYKSFGGWSDIQAVKRTQARDKEKSAWCQKKNNIKMIRIPYTDYDILDEEYLSALLL